VRSKILWTVIFLILLAGLSSAVLFSFVDKAMTTSSNALTETVSFEINRGESFRSISHRLEQMKLINHPKIFFRFAIWKKYDRKIRAGEFELDPTMSPVDILERISSDMVIQYSLTIPEGLPAHAVARIWEDSAFGSGERFLDTLNRLEFDDFQRPKTGWEGYLFPETYHFPKGVDEENAIETMILKFQSVFKESWKSAGKVTGLTEHQLVTLASLIEKETRIDSERALVSSVFHNRLQKGIKLQCDPTVIFAMGPEFSGQLLTRHLERDHPYNTYARKGLPPGPIASPGAASLHAACFPTESDYYFFVADARGGHIFSRTLAEHNKAVRQYRARLKGKR